MPPRKSKVVAEESGPAQNVDSAKRAVLDKAVGDILKRYGDGSIVRLGEAHFMQTETFPTGSLSLDIALGVGGVPRGRITEIYGPESSAGLFDRAVDRAGAVCPGAGVALAHARRASGRGRVADCRAPEQWPRRKLPRQIDSPFLGSAAVSGIHFLYLGTAGREPVRSNAPLPASGVSMPTTETSWWLRLRVNLLSVPPIEWLL